MQFTHEKEREQKIFNFLSIGNINLEGVLGVNKPQIQIIFDSLIEGPPKKKNVLIDVQEKCVFHWGGSDNQGITTITKI